MALLPLLIAGALLGPRLRQQGAGASKLAPDQCQVLVATLRHRRSDFAKPIRSWALAKATFEPLGYEVLRKDGLALALDRTILTGRPEVARVRLLSFLVARGETPTSVRDLPEDLRETMVDTITSIRPDSETRTSALANTVSVGIAAPFRLNLPAGVGRDRRIESYPPPGALPSLSHLPVPEDPSRAPHAGEREAPGLELRLFWPGRWGQGDVLAAWDALRPLVKEREDAVAQKAEQELRAVNDEASRWLEGELGVRKEEDVAYSLLSAGAKAKVAKLAGMTDDALAGTRVRVLVGTPMIHYFSESSGSTWIELKLIAR